MASAPLRSRRIANILKFGITRELIPLLRAQVLLRGLSLQVADAKRYQEKDLENFLRNIEEEQ
jgi:hypothetical protein